MPCFATGARKNATRVNRDELKALLEEEAKVGEKKYESSRARSEAALAVFMNVKDSSQKT